MKLQKAREHKTQTDVLATIADFQYNKGGPPKQVDIVNELPLSKGAVSNNCKKLVDSDLVIEDDKYYRIDEDELLKLYKEHIEDYLTRERKNEIFTDIIEESNKIRTETKKEMNTLLSKEGPRDLIFSILISALIGSLDNNRVQTLREILLWTDQIICRTAQNVITSENLDRDDNKWKSFKLLFLLAVSFNHSHEQLNYIGNEQQFLQTYFPGDVPEEKIIEEFFGGNIDE